MQCKPGFYLENETCIACGGVCLECLSATQCKKCDESKSKLNEITGICECDTHHNWIKDSVNNKNCICNSEFINKEEQCVSCPALIQDCLVCESK